jgi:hypothetical protein
MFGHHDDTSSQQANDGQNDLIEGAVNAEAVDTDRPSGDPGPSAPSMPTEDSVPTTVAPDPTPTTAPPASDAEWQHPGAPLADDNQPSPQPDESAEPGPISDVISPAGGFPKRPTFQDHPDTPAPDESLNEILQPTAGAPDDATRELIDIRQKAVSELVPIVDQLDLPPLEKFRTIMMIIQVSDDEALVKAAYAAAHSITDDKEKAQALLDIVNEVNYFTHQEPAK